MRRQQHPATKLIAFASLLSVFGVVSCGDPEKPPPGAAYDFFITNGNSCGVASGNYLAPDNQNPFYNTQGLTFSDIRLTKADVDCKVVNNGGVFNFSGSVRYITPGEPGSLYFAVSSGVAAGQGSGSARVNTSHTTLYGGLAGDCTLNVQDIASGGVWAEFDCPTVRPDSTAGTATCGLSGAFVFDDCDR